MGLLDFIRGKDPVFTGIVDPKWALDAKGKFHTLFDLDPDEAGLNGVGGVFVIWHGGVHPEWVFVGAANDLGRALAAAADNKDIQQYDVNGRLFVTWSSVVEKYRPGVVRFLVEQLDPLVDNRAAPSRDSEIEPIQVKIPQRRRG
jgi:hypothetical protein